MNDDVGESCRRNHRPRGRCNAWSNLVITDKSVATEASPAGIARVALNDQRQRTRQPMQHAWRAKPQRRRASAGRSGRWRRRRYAAWRFRISWSLSFDDVWGGVVDTVASGVPTGEIRCRAHSWAVFAKRPPTVPVSADDMWSVRTGVRGYGDLAFADESTPTGGRITRLRAVRSTIRTSAFGAARGKALGAA